MAGTLGAVKDRWWWSLCSFNAVTPIKIRRHKVQFWNINSSGWAFCLCSWTLALLWNLLWQKLHGNGLLLLSASIALPSASVLILEFGVVPEKEVEGQAEEELSFSGVFGGRPIRLPFFVKWFKRFRLFGESETFKKKISCINSFH